MMRALLVALALLLSTPSPTLARARDVTPSPAQVRACLVADQPDGCLDALFREYLGAGHSTQEALRLLDRYQTADGELRNSCHPIVHAIGRETFRIHRSVHHGFQLCDGTCHSGCYHGVIERFLGGGSGGHVSQADLEKKAVEACPGPGDTYLRFQCVHGLGHALMYFSGYRLDTALGICDTLPTRLLQRNCYGGVFMENLGAVTPEKRDVSPTDYHHPCRRLGHRYRGDCYLMQTTRMAEMGLWPDKMVLECAKAGPYRRECAVSIGRDLSNYVRVDGPEWVAWQCAWPLGGDRRACLSGVIFALIDNAWDLRYALPFCAALTSGEDRAYCLRSSAAYVVHHHGVSPAAIVAQCRQHFPHGTLCRAVAAATRKPPAAARSAAPAPSLLRNDEPVQREMGKPRALERVDGVGHRGH